MTFIESSQIIESEKFSNISDTIFAEYTSIENFEKNYKYEEVTILEKKIDKNINYIFYINNKLEIKSNTIIFCQTDVVEHFFSLINNLNELENIILVTHQSDKKITKKLFKLKPNSISKWFSTNVCYSHHDLIPIPIGVNNSYYEMHPSSKDIVKAYAKLENEKTDKVYVNFNINTKQFHRFHTLRTVSKNDNFFIQKRKLKKDEYLRELSQFKYTLCPWGNGYDTHRVWESIYLGSVPIVKFHKLYKPIKSIPSITIKSFKNLDFNNFKVNLNEIENEKIYFSYWSHLISNEKKDSNKNNLSYLEIDRENKTYKNKWIKKQKFQSKKKNFRNVIFKIYKKFFIFLN